MSGGLPQSRPRASKARSEQDLSPPAAAIVVGPDLEELEASILRGEGRTLPQNNNGVLG